MASGPRSPQFLGRQGSGEVLTDHYHVRLAPQRVIGSQFGPRPPSSGMALMAVRSAATRTAWADRGATASSATERPSPSAP
jgi:hypothetical protein